MNMDNPNQSLNNQNQIDKLSDNKPDKKIMAAAFLAPYLLLVF